MTSETRAQSGALRRVQQEDSMGCGVACLAMVSGRTYAVVRAGLPEKWVWQLDAVGSGAGISEHGMRYWLNREGFFTRWTYMEGGDPRPVPTSGVAIMLTSPVSEGGPNHWVVLENGRVLDPERETPLPSYDFRQAIEVLSAALTAESEARARDAELGERLRRVLETMNPTDDLVIQTYLLHAPDATIHGSGNQRIKNDATVALGAAIGAALAAARSSGTPTEAGEPQQQDEGWTKKSGLRP